MKGLILKNAYLSSDAYDSQAERLKEELEKLSVETTILRNDFFAITVANNVVINKIKGYDFCVYLDKDKYVAQGLSKCGVKLFNSAESILACDDKMTTYLTLADHYIKLVPTMPAPLCYNPEDELKTGTVLDVEEALGYPVVIKQCYGSSGNNVYIANDRNELINLSEQLKCLPHLFQKCVTSSLGRDVRVIVIGGRVVGAMERRSSTGDFRANIAQGGTATPYPVDYDMERLCLKTARVLGLDYCGIDLLFGEKGEKYVCEVNSNAFFKEFERVTDINVAKAYAEHIVRSVSKKK